MRKFKLPFIITLILALSVTGCSKQNNKKDSQEGAGTEATIAPTEEIVLTPTTSADDSKTAGFNEDELKVLSEELTTQILDGDYTGVCSYFDDSIKQSCTPEVIEQSWKKVIAPLGNFIAISDSKTEEKDNTIFVSVFMEYENNGLQLLYGYNQNVKLTTFRLNYVDLHQNDAKEESDLYLEEDIKVGSGEYIMDGIMTIPKNVEKPPVIIMVQGSGPNDMDETIGANSNKPFRDIAQGLAQKGIATIRYNKRYNQYNDNVGVDATIEDEVLDDVSYAIELAKKSDVLDTSRIYVLGHSLGGMLSPKIASDHPELAGIIAMAGSPRRLEDIIYDQNVYFLDMSEETSESDKESQLETIKAYVEQIKNLTDADLATPIMGIPGYYWKSLNDIDTPKLVSNLKMPMLFLQGSADFQVYPEKDFVEWQTILKGHDNAQFIEYKGLNHLFMPTTGAKDTSDYDFKNNVDPKVISDIADWISKN